MRRKREKGGRKWWRGKRKEEKDEGAVDGRRNNELEKKWGETKKEIKKLEKWGGNVKLEKRIREDYEDNKEIWKMMSDN